MTLLDPLGLFDRSTPRLARAGQAVFVDPSIQPLVFGIEASFRVRNDADRPGRWLPVVRATASTFDLERFRTGTQIDLSPGQTSELQTLRVTGLPRDTYEVELRLEEAQTREQVNVVVQTVRITGGEEPSGFAPGQPQQFFGTVEFADGIAVPAGTVLSARIGGLAAGSVVLRQPGVFGIGTDPLPVFSAEAMAGDPVVFLVNGFQATETAPYEPGGLPDRITLTVPR